MTDTQTAPTTGSVKVGRSNFPSIVRSEWLKLWSLRSTTWTLLALVVVTAGLATLISWGTSSNLDQLSPEDRATFDPTNLTQAGLSLGQLAIAVLGVLIISSEYTTGGIRTTLTAVPNRVQLLGAKVLVFAAVAAVFGAVGAFASFYLGMIFFNRQDVGVALGDPHVLRAVIGGALYVVASGLFSLAVGALVRKSAGAIAVAVAGLFVLPLVTNALPGDWGQTVQKYFISNPGQQITAVNISPDSLGPWAGYGIFCAWWAGLLIIAAFVMARRDA